MEYELTYLIAEDKKPDTQKIQQSVQKAVTDVGGQWQEKQVVEERKLAYDVAHTNRGIYVSQRFALPERDGEKYDPEAITKLSQTLHTQKDLLRFIVVKADELPQLLSREERKTLQEEKAPMPGEKKQTKSENIDKELEKVLKI